MRGLGPTYSPVISPTIPGVGRLTAEPQRGQIAFSRSHSKLGQSQGGTSKHNRKTSPGLYLYSQFWKGRKLLLLNLATGHCVVTGNGVKRETCTTEPGFVGVAGADVGSESTKLQPCSPSYWLCGLKS